MKIHEWLQVMQAWGGLCRGEVGWVGLNVNLFPILIQPFMNDSNPKNINS